MTPEVLQGWLLPVSVTICLVFGVLITGISLRRALISISAAVVAYAFVGLIFLSTPKWTTMTLNFWGVKAQIAELVEERDRAVAEAKELAGENRTIELQIAKLNALAGEADNSADQAVGAIAAARQGIAWATFLPDSASDYKIAVSDKNLDAIAPLAKRLNIEEGALLQDLEQAGFTILTGANLADLENASAKDLWIAPYDKVKR